MSFRAPGGPITGTLVRPVENANKGEQVDTPGDYIVQANGVDLCIESFGDPADPAILLIHGAGSSMLSWDEELCERLAAGRRFVIRYDSRDASRSVTYEPAAPQYALGDLVADAVGLLDSFGLASAHLVGMSAGAAIAQLVALDHPDRVASLTLALVDPRYPRPRDSRPSGDLRGAQGRHHAPAAGARLGRSRGRDRLPGRGRAPVCRPFAPFDEAAMRDLAGRVFDRSANIAANLTNPFILDAGDPWRQRLGQVAAPTLVVHGSEDPLFPYGHALVLAREIPGAHLLALEQTGHEYFPRATWDLVVPAILRHTSGRPRSRTHGSRD
jgi:pimeloyl-ACP methyl ester carboxylesterase